MQKKTWWLALSSAVVAICTFVYLLFFIWKLNPYFGLITAFIIGFLFVVTRQKDRMRKNYRQILRESSIVLGLCAIYTNLYVCISIFHVNFAYIFLIPAVASVIAGASVSNMARSMIYVCISASSGVAIAVALTLSPTLWAGDYAMFNYALVPTINSIMFPFLFVLIISLFGAIAGDFLGDSLR